MNAMTIWIDRENAKIFRITNAGSIEEQALHAHHTDHHTHAFDGKDITRIEHHFYKEILQKISGATQLLLIGPGIAKHHFQNYLVEHQPLLAKHLVGCETVDHPTDHQIAALTKKYFDERVTS